MSKTTEYRTFTKGQRVIFGKGKEKRVGWVINAKPVANRIKVETLDGEQFSPHLSECTTSAGRRPAKFAAASVS